MEEVDRQLRWEEESCTHNFSTKQNRLCLKRWGGGAKITGVRNKYLCKSS